MVKHRVILRGYHAAINDHLEKPVLVKRTDQEFIPAVLDGVGRKATPDALGRIGREAIDSKDDALRLFQPVHRTFNLVLLEAICDQPGSPRLNPREIVSAGFVVRRFNGGIDEGWMLRDDRVLGWSRPAELHLDPDPSQRKPRLNAGNPHVNGRLARLFEALEPAAERVSPLFVAPPDVCANAGRTVLYGMVPVTSAERADDAQPAVIDFEDVKMTTPGFLRPPGEPFYPIGANLVPNQTKITIGRVEEKLRDEPNGPLSNFVQDLRLLQFGWRLFDPQPVTAILALLNQPVKLNTWEILPMGEYLRRACAIFILRTNPAGELPLPETWPQLDAGLVAQIRAAAQKELEAAVRSGLPNEQRFDLPDALYRAHAFMRVRSADGCPPHLQWSEPSEAFRIVPWWESGGAPLHTITLPDIDAASVKLLKPNISFAVPPKLAALLKNNSPEKFMKGEAGTGSLGIGWICSFSIPIITLCAFIVLNIFLTLLHIVFQWLFYIKICLPYPKRT